MNHYVNWKGTGFNFTFLIIEVLPKYLFGDGEIPSAMSREKNLCENKRLVIFLENDRNKCDFIDVQWDDVWWSVCQ